MRILIVEDEIRISEGIEKLLHKIDSEYEIAGIAADGIEGLQMCRQLNPDLIITDVQMPEMDGLKMLEAVYAEGFAAKAIVISAYSEFEYARGAMKLGVTEYLLKPVNLSEFTNALENIKHQIMEVAYLGDRYETGAVSGKSSLSHSLSLYEGISYCSLEIEYLRSVISIVYNCQDPKDFERWVQYHLFGSLAYNAAIGYTVAESLTQIRSALDRLLPYMDWNLSFEDSVLISYPKITQVQTSMCVNGRLS